MTFQEWLAIRERLWLNDDKAVEGLSELLLLFTSSATSGPDNRDTGTDAEQGK
ncbi:hypothetical protein [Stieleria varia]|uniref:Uncharacterized protein n=1 Tax=Stieleria varia TaxID=2528005 RepID=A0A5C6AUC8_9BACT|nr:hypothetical protein [Stieleria varia]TWU02612.1 hypothetical protein Pla52n_36680 [Stieleria varia]